MALSNWLRSLSATHGHAAAPKTRRSRKASPGRKLFLERLEERTVLSPYLVTTTADSGPGSLRDAITQVNADTNHTLYASPSSPGVDEIDFGISALSDTGGGYNTTMGVATIAPLSALPTITNAVLINGYTQIGASPNTLSQGDNAALKIALSGAQAVSTNGVIGLTIAATGCTVQGLAVNGFTFPGIQIQGGDSVEGNFIGTDVTGTKPVGNFIGIDSYGVNNVIGGTTPGARNIVSGNGLFPSRPSSPTSAAGILARGTGDLIEGNYIGTDATGTIALGNGPAIGNYGGGGIYIANEASESVGGTAPGAGNLISGNGVGINAANFQSSGPLPVIQGNLIGTDVTGTKALGNTDGIDIDGYFLIGGTTSSARNIISGNFDYGIAGEDGVVEGNYIGTDITGTVAVGNGTAGIYTVNGGFTIGGTAPGAGNLVSGNGTGIFDPKNTVVQGNLIGTDYTGTKALRNIWGILEQGGINNNLIGGTAQGARNVISGNAGGILIRGSGDVVEGNYIGTGLSGSTAIGDDGVTLSNEATGNTVGGTTVAARNIIVGSVGLGDISGGSDLNLASNNLVEGNYIGMDVTGTKVLGTAGVGFSGALNNTIGGSAPGAGNVISGGVGFDSGNNPNYPNSGNVVQDNYIGTDATGTKALGTGTGVQLSDIYDTNNVIGGTDTNAPGAALVGAGNLISGTQGTGILLIGSSGNRIQGNYVGTDVTGTHALGNTHGIGLAYGATSNWIGTTGLKDYGDRNVVSGNTQTGVYLIFAGTSQNIVAGNYIGTDATGTHPLGNGGAGVAVGWTAQNNQIGALGPLATTLPNTIAFNGLSGVWVISDSATGDNTTGNSIRDNSIHDNAGLGIDLGGDYNLSNGTPVPGPDGVTLNDSEGHAAPNNPNNFQDFPILTSAITNKGGVTIIAGSFNSGTLNGAPFEPNTNITVDFYANPTPAHPFTDPATGISHYYGEGQIYLGSQTYQTNPKGTFKIGAFKPSVTVPVGYYVTATATDSAGNTSEFGPDVLVTLPQNASHGMAQMAASSGSDVAATAGALVAEDLGLYVDNSNGDLTAHDLARIQDALTAVDTVTAPYGATITQVSDPTQADVTLTMDTTSAVGGYADGVLGCYSNAGAITLIQGWNWYAGSDPTQVGAAQYDFETTVVHELGHALGLGESSDPTSAMSGTLATGTVIRTLTTADLNVPFDDTAADPQRVALSSPALVSVSRADENTGRPMATLPSAGPRGLLVYEPMVRGPDAHLAWTLGAAAFASPSLGLDSSSPPATLPNPVPTFTTRPASLWIASVSTLGSCAADDSQETEGDPSWLPGGTLPEAEPPTPAANPPLSEQAIDVLLARLDAREQPPSAVAVEPVFVADASTYVGPVRSGYNGRCSETAEPAPVDAGWAWAAILGLLWKTEVRVRRGPMTAKPIKRR